MKKTVVILMVFGILMGVVLGSDKILVYISGPEKMVSMIEEAFEKENGDCVDVFHTGSGPLRQKIWTEMMAGSIQADIIWGAEPMMYYSLLEHDVLSLYYPENYDKMDSRYKIGEGYFTSTSIRYSTIILNKDLIQAAQSPLSWADLADARFKGQLAMADASQSAMAFAIFSGIYTLENGREILDGIGHNDVFVTKMNMDAISLVQSGEKAICIAPTDGALRLIKSQKSKGLDPVLKIAWPDEGGFVIQRPVALVNRKRTPAQERVAKAFMDFTLSEQCQKLSSKFGFETVRGDLDYGTFDNQDALLIDWSEILHDQDEILDYYYSIIM